MNQAKKRGGGVDNILVEEWDGHIRRRVCGNVPQSPVVAFPQRDISHTPKPLSFEKITITAKRNIS